MVKSKLERRSPRLCAADYRYGSAALADLHRQRTESFSELRRARSDGNSVKENPASRSSFPESRVPAPRIRRLISRRTESVALWMVACRATS